MINHYNAFISYRHAPLDSEVAEHVQHALERFNIPDKIREKTGMKRIQRVFRDKEELPITSNLSETISAALEDADFLIVICSHSTKESEWVRREIQYFLQHHSRDHVLTVLAEGDPYEVIPEELLSEERKYIDTNGVEHTIRVPLEPLSCDYRLPRRQADKEELPRLAAPIIGCSYDELMNRRRAYRIRRLLLAVTLIFAIMLAFGAYMFRSSMKIRENYQQALKNQSLYLAHESQSLLKSKHRTEAMLVAQAALPGENGDRPVTSEAVRALTDATLAYKALDGYSINPVFTYSLPGEVGQFAVSKDGLYLAAYDKIGNCYVWDAVNHTRLYEIENISNRILDITFYSEAKDDKDTKDKDKKKNKKDDILLIQSTTAIVAFDAETGNELWNYAPSLTTYSGYNRISICGTYVFVTTFSNTVQKFDAKTGELVSEYKIKFPSSVNASPFTISHSTVSPDGKAIAFLATDRVTEKHYGYIDLVTSEVRINEYNANMFLNIGWYDEKHFLVAAVPEGQNDIDYTSQGMTVMNGIDMEILCLDITDTKTETISLLWTSSFASRGRRKNSGFVPLYVKNAIAYYRGNICEVFDIKTGERMHLYDAEDSLVDCSDSDVDGELLFINSKGDLGVPFTGLGKDMVGVINVFSNAIGQATICEGFYTNDTASCDIIYYKVHVGDDDFTTLSDDPGFSVIDESMVDEDILAVISHGENSTRVLQIIDMKTNELIASNNLNDDLQSSGSSIYFAIAGIADGKIYIVAVGSELGTTLMIYDANTGALEDTVGFNGKLMLMNRDSLLVDGKIVFLILNDKDYELDIYDSVKEKTEMYDLDESEMDSLRNAASLQYLPEKKLVIITVQAQDYYYDLESEELLDLDLPESWKSAFSASCSGDLMAITDESTILIFGKKGDPIEISTNGKQCVDVKFVSVNKQDILMAVFDDGTLYRYNPKNGELLGITNISLDGNATKKKLYIFSDDGSELYLKVSSALSIIDTKTWYEIAAIPNYLGYCQSKDRFYAYSFEVRSNTKIGYFPHYSVADLVEKAKDLCGEAQLSEEQKSTYGI